MNPTDILLSATLTLVLIGLVYALVSWRAGYGAGRILEGLGLVALSVGLFLSGLMKLAYDLIAALIGWGMALVWTPLVATGIAALVLAVVLWLVSGALNRRGVGVRTKEAIQARREERRAARAAKGRPGATPARSASGGTPASTSRSTAATGAAPTAEKKSGDEFDEIEDILRKRGIS
ncbi:hypothetical protein [Raineyella sp. LH-20]|uniref:hypothetical protein n=1 Tax=Raineyella sp. LH-20 TaxID=3081204 RepID=UPI002955CB99|nr:hypothetical protein [Raineyella sp. LH-20]WOP18383.1 hypothetical protein R0146_14335 [Raineyella sp. LH-20]